VKDISQNSVDRSLEGALERLILFVAAGKDTSGAYDEARDLLVKWAVKHADSLERSISEILHDEDERSSQSYKQRLLLAHMMFHLPMEVIWRVSHLLAIEQQNKVLEGLDKEIAELRRLIDGI
jgi:hypothetical protein